MYVFMYVLIVLYGFAALLVYEKMDDEQYFCLEDFEQTFGSGKSETIKHNDFS
jgi:hypothetical protein